MPFINAKFSTPVSPDKELALKSALGEAITLLGKSERYLMVEISDNCRLYFGGRNDAPIAFFDVSLLHSAPRESYEALTARLCEIAKDVMDVDGDHVYVKFEETENWGFNSFMF
ncbi:phenylpyruvate tautomerase MIF-related protein [Ruminococcus sp.]|uniref:phenylpyruvate tautomerase MIF-related protein n=1 Tax=Ruminococcus sp. TaxID=41978 RepID=UPI003870EE0E